MRVLNRLIALGAILIFASSTLAAGNSGSTGGRMDSTKKKAPYSDSATMMDDYTAQKSRQKSNEMKKRTSRNTTLEETDVFQGRASGGSSNFSDSATGISR